MWIQRGKTCHIGSFQNISFYLTLEKTLPNLSQLCYMMALDCFLMSPMLSKICQSSNHQGWKSYFTSVHKSKCFFHLMEHFGLYSLWGRRVEIKPSLQKWICLLFYLCQRHGSLRMPETSKERLVVTFFALSKNYYLVQLISHIKSNITDILDGKIKMYKAKIRKITPNSQMCYLHIFFSIYACYWWFAMYILF